METILILAMEGMHESLNGERRLAARTGASLARRKLRLLTGRRTGRTTSAPISQLLTCLPATHGFCFDATFCLDLLLCFALALGFVRRNAANTLRFHSL